LALWLPLALNGQAGVPRSEPLRTPPMKA
jgi:hypothetical protein